MFQRWLATGGKYARGKNATGTKPNVKSKTATERTIQPEKPERGPGTVLSSVFEQIGIKVSSECQCKRHAKKMNLMGTRWCIENTDTIVGWLEEEAKLRNLPFFRAGVKVALQGLLHTYSMFESFSAKSPSAPFTRKDSEWAVAITSAPRRREYTLGTCLESIIAAGWDNPIVFAEPSIEVPDGVTAIHNESRRGCFHNWLYSAEHCLGNTNAEMILCVQDDSLFHPDTRRFTEDFCLWPSADTGVVSLYTAAHYSRGKTTLRPTGINEVFTRAWWGTCAVVWRREVLQNVVNHEIIRNWLGVSPRKRPDEHSNPPLRSKRVKEYYENRKLHPEQVNNSDYVAGHVLNLLGYKKYFVDPSPVSHISKVSTIGHGGNKGRRNCLRCADHNIALIQQVGTDVNHAAKAKNDPQDEQIMETGRGLKPGGNVVVVTPAESKGATPQHTFLIRSSYENAAMSEYRWNITQKTLLKSFAAQKNKDFDIEIICGANDVLREVKLKAFGEIAPTRIAPVDWYNQPHDGIWRRTTRIDDDDLLSVEFVNMIASQPFDETECLFNFPVGCLWADGVSYLWKYPPNQFITIQSNTRLTPYHFAHQYFRLAMPTVIVSDEVHWMWIRHHGVLSGAEPGSIPKKFRHEIIETNTALFPYDFNGIAAATGKDQSAIDQIKILRSQHGRWDRDVLDICNANTEGDLSSLASIYNTDKGTAGPGHQHQYTIVYDQLLKDRRNEIQHVLEFGVGKGASMKMWADYFPNAHIHGLDLKKCRLQHPRISTHRFNALSNLETTFSFDLVIDDASHISSHQRRMFELHSKHVRTGGYYVIEDLHACRLGRRYLNESPSMLETCRAWVSEPPLGWTCNLYGDQLCVLQKRDL